MLCSNTDKWYWKLYESTGKDELCRIITNHCTEFDDETMVIAWQCILRLRAQHSRKHLEQDESEEEDDEGSVRSERTGLVSPDAGSDVVETLSRLQSLTIERLKSKDVITRLKPKHLSRIVHDFAVYKYRMGDELKDSLLCAVMDWVSTSESTERSVFTQSDQVNILWSFASLEITPAKFFESISLATGISEGLGPEMMAKLLWALAVSETTASDTVLQKIASDVEKMASRLKRKDLEVAVTSLEKLGQIEHADRVRRFGLILY